MAKNMTLKSLAVGAAFALTASGLFAMPAQASAGIDLAAQGGKSVYGMLSGETFTFTANGNVNFLNSNAGLLRVEVVNTTGGGSPTGFAINGIALDGNRTAGNGTSNTIELANGDETAVSLGAAAGDKAVMGLGADAANAAATALGSVMTSPFTFSFSATAAAETTQAYAVTVFADTNNNGVKDAGELASATQSVTFFNAADVTVNYVIDAPVEGALTVGSDVTISGIALDQLVASEFGVLYTLGTDAALGTQAAKLDIVAFDTNRTKFESDLALTFANGGLVKATVVKAQLRHLNAGPNVNGTDGASVGKFGLATVAAAKVADVTASVVNSVNANATNFKPDTSFTVKALVEDAANGSATAKPVAGQAVTARIEVLNIAGNGAETLSATRNVTVNGVKYVTAASLPGTGSVAQIPLTTDAKGEVTLTIETLGLEGTGNDAATNSVKVTFTSELISDAGSTLTLEARDAAFTAYIANHDATSATTVDGTGVVFQIEVYDQYGARPADVYDARAVFVSSNQGAAAARNSTSATSVVQPVIGGRASFTVTDNGTGTGANVYAVSVEARAAGGGYSGGTILAANEVNAGNFTINLIENATPGAITAAGFTKQTTGANTGRFTMTAAEKKLALATFGAYNANSVLGTEPTGLLDDGTANDESHDLSGTVTTAASATAVAVALVGVPVTVSGAGLQFVYVDSNNKKIYATDSITIVSGAAGAWAVDVFSNKAGTQTVTVTAGGVTETLLVNDYADAAANTGASLVIAAPDSVLPGSTLSITATLTDKYGNPVAAGGVNTAVDNGADFKVGYTGPGLQVGSNPTAYGADGTAKLGYFLGTNDSGTITVVFQYDANGDFDFADTGDLTVSKTITIGAAAAKTAYFTKRAGDKIQIVSQGSAKVRFMLNGKRVATRSSLGTLNRTFDLAAGKNVIEIYVDGERVLRRAATK